MRRRTGTRRWPCWLACPRHRKSGTWPPRRASVRSSKPGGALEGDGIEAKLDGLLDRVREDDAARQEFVDLLELLGPDDPRTASYRKALTARLF